MSRLHYLLTTEEYVLHQFGGNLRNCFPNAPGIFHVGSSLLRPDYRDVDVRVVLADDEYDRLAQITDPKVLSVALSLWGQNYTKLPIDCQVQTATELWVEQDKPRHSIGGLPIHKEGQ